MTVSEPKELIAELCSRRNAAVAGSVSLETLAAGTNPNAPYVPAVRLDIDELDMLLSYVETLEEFKWMYEDLCD